VDPRDGPTRDSPAPGAAAQALLALVAPLRFAVKDGFAGLARLAGFGETLRGAVARARALGAPDSPALTALAEEGARFDGLPAAERRRAAGRLAVHLAALVPVPEEIAAVARAAKAEWMGGRASPSATATAKPPKTGISSSHPSSPGRSRRWRRVCHSALGSSRLKGVRSALQDRGLIGQLVRVAFALRQRVMACQ